MLPMRSDAGRHLRVGLLLDGLVVPAWVRLMIERVRATGCASIVLVVVGATDKDFRSDPARFRCENASGAGAMGCRARGSRGRCVRAIRRLEGVGRCNCPASRAARRGRFDRGVRRGRARRDRSVQFGLARRLRVRAARRRNTECRPSWRVVVHECRRARGVLGVRGRAPGDSNLARARDRCGCQDPLRVCFVYRAYVRLDEPKSCLLESCIVRPARDRSVVPRRRGSVHAPNRGATIGSTCRSSSPGYRETRCRRGHAFCRATTLADAAPVVA